MKAPKRPEVEPHLREAVLDLLRAEKDFIRSYDRWTLERRPDEGKAAQALEAAERRVDEARKQAAWWEKLAHEQTDADDE